MQLEARLLRKRHGLPEGLPIASVRSNTLWINDDRGRTCEGGIESDRGDPEAVRNDLGVDTAAAPARRRGTERSKRRTACRTSRRSRNCVSPEHELGKPMIRTQRLPHGCGKALLWIGAHRGRGCSRRSRGLMAPATARCDERDREASDDRGRPHAANPRDSSWLRKRGPVPSHARLAPVPSKSGLTVRRFPSTPWTSTISST
jgi:hypothetical protein